MQNAAFSFRSPLRLCAFAGKLLFRVPVVLIVLCLAAVTAVAGVKNLVTVAVSTPGKVRIVVDSQSPGRSWSFRNAYAGILGIAERVEDFRATTASEQDARVKKIATGEFRSELDASKISYSVDVSKAGAADVSHVSWVMGDYGLLMLADLLPQDFTSVSVRFDLPPGWSVGSSNSADAGLYQVAGPEKAVFFVGRSFRQTGKSVDGIQVTALTGGTWPFKDRDALSAATRVMKSYLELTGFKLPAGAFIMIAP